MKQKVAEYRSNVAFRIGVCADQGLLVVGTYLRKLVQRYVAEPVLITLLEHFLPKCLAPSFHGRKGLGDWRSSVRLGLLSHGRLHLMNVTHSLFPQIISSRAPAAFACAL